MSLEDYQRQNRIAAGVVLAVIILLIATAFALMVSTMEPYQGHFWLVWLGAVGAVAGIAGLIAGYYALMLYWVPRTSGWVRENLIASFSEEAGHRTQLALVVVVGVLFLVACFAQATGAMELFVDWAYENGWVDD